jgi:hypothetical protein
VQGGLTNDEIGHLDKTSVMHSTETKAAVTATAADRSATIVRPSPPTVMRCLLVSECRRHLQHIAQTADREGWTSVTHHLVPEAIREAVLTRFHLAFVDVQSVVEPDTQNEYEQLAADLARGHVPLIVISGDAEDPMAEIRARQLGVWLYLPGFDESTGLEIVFREARAATDKLQHPDDVSNGSGPGPPRTVTEPANSRRSRRFG